MKLIETYYHSEEGYNPFLIRDGWQVAQLNYLPNHSFDSIDKIEVHKKTDEVFILFEGEAVLIAGDITDSNIVFETIKMVKGVTYNLPAGTWHNIAMNKEAKMIIVENSMTHLNDCAYIELSESQKSQLLACIQNDLK